MTYMPTADVSVTDSAVEIASGLYDTDDGFKVKVAGDEFWRVHITPQGGILVGDGTSEPYDLLVVFDELTNALSSVLNTAGKDAGDVLTVITPGSPAEYAPIP